MAPWQPTAVLKYLCRLLACFCDCMLFVPELAWFNLELVTLHKLRRSFGCSVGTLQGRGLKTRLHGFENSSHASFGESSQSPKPSHSCFCSLAQPRWCCLLLPEVPRPSGCGTSSAWSDTRESAHVMPVSSLSPGGWRRVCPGWAGLWHPLPTQRKWRWKWKKIMPVQMPGLVQYQWIHKATWKEVFCQLGWSLPRQKIEPGKQVTFSTNTLLMCEGVKGSIFTLTFSSHSLCCLTLLTLREVVQPPLQHDPDSFPETQLKQWFAEVLKSPLKWYIQQGKPRLPLWTKSLEVGSPLHQCWNLPQVILWRARWTAMLTSGNSCGNLEAKFHRLNSSPKLRSIENVNKQHEQHWVN